MLFYGFEKISAPYTLTMSNLIKKTPEAIAWGSQKESELGNDPAFGQITIAVIWADTTDPTGKLLVETNPSKIVSDINGHGWPLLRGHDPGLPSGRVVAAKLFKSPSGVNFVAAMLGFYDDKHKLRFSDLGLDTNPDAPLPTVLPPLKEDCWIKFSADPREIDEQWINEIIQNAPIKIVKATASHNAADPLIELIRINLPYVLLVWNPFVKAMANEAGKDAYAAIRNWLKTTCEGSVRCKNPIICLDSHQHGCDVSFILRGNNVKQTYAAHESLPAAAAKAAMLIHNMKEEGFAPSTLIYEFDPEAMLWFPQYAILKDGHLISDHNILIAVEQMPRGLSMGFELQVDL